MRRESFGKSRGQSCPNSCKNLFNLSTTAHQRNIRLTQGQLAIGLRHPLVKLQILALDAVPITAPPARLAVVNIHVQDHAQIGA